MKKLRYHFYLLLLIILFLPFFVFAQSLFFETSNISAPINSTFSLPLKISTTEQIFSISFDLNFDPSLVQYVSSTEGSFLNQGCSTALLATENPAGKLIFGLTRLGSACGGVAGSGTVVTLNFKSLGQAGTSALAFSNNSACVLNGAGCNDLTGTWTGATVVIGTSGASNPPAISSVSATSISANSATISWATDQPADSQVEYGLTLSYGQQTSANLAFTTSHSIIINGLNSGILYHFRARSKNSSGLLTISSDNVFTTLSAVSVCSVNGNPANR